MKVSEMFPSRFLRVVDLEEKPRLVTIEAIRSEAVVDDEDDKPVLYFRNMKPGLVLNKTNAKSIADFLGDNSDGWPGNEVVLFPAITDLRGKTVPCIRVRQRKPAPVAPTPAPAPVATGEDDAPF